MTIISGHDFIDILKIDVRSRPLFAHLFDAHTRHRSSHGSFRRCSTCSSTTEANRCRSVNFNSRFTSGIGRSRRFWSGAWSPSAATLTSAHDRTGGKRSKPPGCAPSGPSEPFSCLFEALPMDTLTGRISSTQTITAEGSSRWPRSASSLYIRKLRSSGSQYSYINVRTPLATCIP